MKGLRHFLMKRQLRRPHVKRLAQITNVSPIGIHPGLTAVNTWANDRRHHKMIKAITSGRRRFTFFVANNRAYRRRRIVDQGTTYHGATNKLDGVSNEFRMVPRYRRFFSQVSGNGIIATHFWCTNRGNSQRFLTATGRHDISTVQTLPRRAGTVRSVFCLNGFLVSRDFRLHRQRPQLNNNRSHRGFNGGAFNVTSVKWDVLTTGNFFGRHRRIINSFNKNERSNNRLPLPNVTFRGVNGARGAFYVYR